MDAVLSESRPLLFAIDRFCSLLNQATSGEDQLDAALDLVAGEIGADGIFFYRKILNKDGTFRFSRFCRRSAGEKGPGDRPFRCEDVAPGVWARLEAGEEASFQVFPLSSKGSPSHVILFPVFLYGHLSCFLGLSFFRERRLDEAERRFLRSVCGILELWIGRMNVEKRLDDIVNFIPTPTFVMTTDERITMWNRATEEMTGWTRARMVNKDHYESSIPFYNERRPMVANLIMYPDRKWEGTYAEFERRGDRVFSLAYCPALPGGGAFLRCNTERLYDLNGRLWGAIHTVRDVTLERQMKKDLHRSKSMYRAISDFAGVAIMLFRDDKVLYYNERLAKFMGISGRGISKDDLLAWVHPEDREKIVRHSRDLLNGRRPHSRFEFRAGRNGDFRYYRAYSRLTEYEDFTAIHFILDDITEQKELARKARLNELRLYHEDRLTALGIMAAGIAHELNQPLNTIRVVTDGLLFGREEGWEINQEELFENLEMISRQIVRMSEVIQNVRNFSRDDSENLGVDVSANEAIENVFSMLGRQLEAHGIHVEKDMAQDLPPIKTSLNRLEQVIMNLVVNARQALDACAHDNRELRVATGARNGNVVIEVGDNAAGIPEGLLVKIFDPFFTTKEVGKGTGLGLSISQSIVSEFKGRIHAFNNDRGGATFVVTAPVSGAGS